MYQVKLNISLMNYTQTSSPPDLMKFDEIGVV